VTAWASLTVFTNVSQYTTVIRFSQRLKVTTRIIKEINEA
jgi:hypothetical protein